MANGNGNGRWNFNLPENTPMWLVAAVLIAGQLLRYAVPAPMEPMETRAWDQLASEMRNLTSAVKSLSDLEEARMQRTSLSYPPDEWKAQVRKIDEMHRSIVRLKQYGDP